MIPFFRASCALCALAPHSSSLQDQRPGSVQCCVQATLSGPQAPCSWQVPPAPVVNVAWESHGGRKSLHVCSPFSTIRQRYLGGWGWAGVWQELGAAAGPLCAAPRPQPQQVQRRSRTTRSPFGWDPLGGAPWPGRRWPRLLLRPAWRSGWCCVRSGCGSPLSPGPLVLTAFALSCSAEPL